MYRYNNISKNNQITFYNREYDLVVISQIIDKNGTYAFKVHCLSEFNRM